MKYELVSTTRSFSYQVIILVSTSSCKFRTPKAVSNVGLGCGGGLRISLAGALSKIDGGFNGRSLSFTSLAVAKFCGQCLMHTTGLFKLLSKLIFVM